MIVPAGTTVAVADGETVRVFQNTGAKHGVHLVETTGAPPARHRSGSGERHHSGSTNRDARRLAEDGFAAEAAEFLNALDLAGRIEKLVVVADPRTLGEMRKHLKRDLKNKIISEIAKDFTQRPLEEIQSLIARG